jgi:hypothetical protein
MAGFPAGRGRQTVKRNRWFDKGLMSLEAGLIMALLVLTAGATLFGLGKAVQCVFANEAVSAAVAGKGPEAAAGLDYPGSCVPIRMLEASAGQAAGTVDLVWVGGEGPFKIYGSETSMVAFKAPSFVDVAYAADGALLQDLDGNPNDRHATVTVAAGQSFYKVVEARNGAAVTNFATKGLRRLTMRDAITGQPLANMSMAEIAEALVSRSGPGNPLSLSPFPVHYMTDGQGQVIYSVSDTLPLPSWTLGLQVLGSPAVTMTAPPTVLGGPQVQDLVFDMPRPEVVQAFVGNDAVQGVLPGAAATCEGETFYPEADGFIRVRQRLASGSHTVTLSAPGYLSSTATFTVLPMEVDGQRQSLPLEGWWNLRPAASIDVTVQDASGHPLSGATVDLGGKTATTSVSGVATLSGLSVGSAFWTVLCPSYVTRTGSVDLVRGSNSMVLTLSPPVLTGTISVTATKSPVGAAVGKTVTVVSYSGVTVAMGTTDSQGKVTFPGLPVIDSPSHPYSVRLTQTSPNPELTKSVYLLGTTATASFSGVK